MPKFFLPGATDDKMAEDTLAAIRKFIEGQVFPLDQSRIFRLTYRHNGRDYIAEVGKVDVLQRETVIAIFKCDNYGLYCVATENRGVARDGPILVGQQDLNTR